MSAIGRVVESCFCGKTERVEITALVLLYLGEVFNRTVLQINYAGRHRKDVLKSRPLQIVYMCTSDEKEQVTETLKSWHAIAKSQYRRAKRLFDETPGIDNAAFDSMSFWDFYKDCIELAQRGIFDRGLNAAAMNSRKEIEGISYSYPDMTILGAWYISCLISAPWNHIEGLEFVRGAGTALVEHAALQSLKLQGIDPDAVLAYSVAAKSVVRLQASGTAYAFYSRLFFMRESQHTQFYMTLSGENAVRFFKQFGGRASSKTLSIEV